MKQSTDNGVDFEMEELLRKEEQMIRDKYLVTKDNGFTYYDTSKMTPEDLKLHESHRPFKDSGDNRTGLTVMNDRMRLQNEYNYLNGRIPTRTRRSRRCAPTPAPTSSW